MNHHTRGLATGLLSIALMLGAVTCFAQDDMGQAALDDAFKGAQTVDLATSKVESALTLREVVKIPPPSEPVLVKTFSRDQLPPVLRQFFAKPGVRGVTINGRFVAIIKTQFRKEYDDILSHELVHAYTSLVSPKPLPFWFQEGGAVHFSMGKARKFYGQPSKESGVMEGRAVQVDPVYEQKLLSFQYMIEKAGKTEFNEWYKNAVVTGVVDPNALLSARGLASTQRRESTRPIPLWFWIAAGAVVLVVTVIGIIASRRTPEFY